MTNKTLDQLNAGDFVADMHDGLAPILDRFTILHRITWDTDWSTTPHRIGGFGFENKELRVLGLASGAFVGGVVCGYQYDGRTAGIIVLGEKEREG